MDNLQQGEVYPGDQRREVARWLRCAAAALRRAAIALHNSAPPRPAHARAARGAASAGATGDPPLAKG